ncbi:glycosyltransferase [Paenibacillus sp. FSL H7-0357]|uniref:glycosyltransferase family 2 protein n=1 Tax=Paenibacillus sp. FSL H7-0357 TaxID=1536774 RepID=UPI0004F8D5C6|nr:glycosyltransferase family 2 protein [Paenibacillus sp. FSL H7-0357]AIQ20834.1 glycosyltransferase [Paenibacillus sp. FSL H7-0357]
MNSNYIISPNLTLVIPCYNEEAVLPETIRQLTLILNNLIQINKISQNSKILFIDDGSRDSTWELIESNNKVNKYVHGLKLAKNAGHQNALLAGLISAKDYSDIIISIDADLQDDLNVIHEFINKYEEGYDVVYGVRKSRSTDTFFKRSTAQGFYRLMNSMGVNLVFNHADYRLMSKRAVQHLSEFKEVNLFLRGLVPLIGFRSTEVYYDRNERFAGESKYPLKKMLAFAFDGITSFSVTPIRLITGLGFIISLFSILVAIYILISKFSGSTTSGWSSLMISIWFIGGVQLVALGLIGEYIGKIYKEVKARPKYIIEKLTLEVKDSNQNESKELASLAR